MKRLLRIGFDIFITSFTPIVAWFFIGIIINKELTNTFALTYPIQCLMGIILSIFGVGANVCSIRDNNKNSADNGIIYGIIISFILYGLIALNCNSFIGFMNMKKKIFYIFCLYSIGQIFLQTILHLVLTKLYYLEFNKKANKYSIIFNSLNFIGLVGTSLITKNQVIISILTLSLLTIFDIILLYKNIDKIDWKLNLKNCFKYDSVSCSMQIMFFIIYLLGFSNSFAYGDKYIVAITFATLITDIQWDMAAAIKTAAKIDIVKRNFDYNYHFKNALYYIFLLITSILLMGIILYPIYNPNLFIVSIFVSLHIADFITVPFTTIKICYLEIEYSAAKTTKQMIIGFIIRTIVSLMHTPYCTIIGQMCDAVYELLFATIAYKLFNNKKGVD